MEKNETVNNQACGIKSEIEEIGDIVHVCELQKDIKENIIV